MRLLLDTNALLWWLSGSPQLGSRTRAEVGDPANDVCVSAVTGAEIAIKKAIGKLTAPDDVAERIAADGFIELPLTLRHGLEVSSLPMHHRDPFDRMLVAQARCEGLVLVTSDRALLDYDVRILPAPL